MPCPSDTPVCEEEPLSRRHVRRIGRRAVFALLLALPLAACGRKGQPEPPEDADPKAPRHYPVQ